MPARSAIALACLLALTALCATVFAEQHPTAPVYVVIVNPGSQAAAVDRQFLEDAFLKKVTTWPNGEVIRPVDLAPDSPVRARFTHDVLNRTVEAVKGYWQQRIFSGRDVPPPEFAVDDDVVKFVLKHTGGLGYVSGGASVGDAKTVAVR